MGAIWQLIADEDVEIDTLCAPRAEYGSYDFINIPVPLNSDAQLTVDTNPPTIRPAWTLRFIQGYRIDVQGNKMANSCPIARITIIVTRMWLDKSPIIPAPDKWNNFIWELWVGKGNAMTRFDGHIETTKGGVAQTGVLAVADGCPGSTWSLLANVVPGNQIPPLRMNFTVEWNVFGTAVDKHIQNDEFKFGPTQGTGST